MVRYLALFMSVGLLIAGINWAESQARVGNEYDYTAPEKAARLQSAMGNTTIVSEPSAPAEVYIRIAKLEQRVESLEGIKLSKSSSLEDVDSLPDVPPAPGPEAPTVNSGGSSGNIQAAGGGSSGSYSSPSYGASYSTASGGSSGNFSTQAAQYTRFYAAPAAAQVSYRPALFSRATYSSGVVCEDGQCYPAASYSSGFSRGGFFRGMFRR